MQSLGEIGEEESRLLHGRVSSLHAEQNRHQIQPVDQGLAPAALCWQHVTALWGVLARGLFQAFLGLPEVEAAPSARKADAQPVNGKKGTVKAAHGYCAQHGGGRKAFQGQFSRGPL